MLYERCPSVLWRHALGRLVLLDAGSPDAEPMIMDGLGVIAWLALDRPSTEADLRSELADLDGSDDGAWSTVLGAALDELVGRGLLRTSA